MRWQSTALMACVLGIGALRICAAQTSSALASDPPARVGRLSDLSGPVSLYPAGANDWSAASLNYPLTTGDAVWADTSARAEIDLGPSALRLAAQTSMVFGEVSDSVTQVRMDQGSIDVHVRYLGDSEVYEIDTPAGVISLLDEGHYRIDVTPDGRRSSVTVRDGSAEVVVGDRNYPVGAGTSATLLSAGSAPIAGAAVPTDDWERWADGRDAREDDVESTQYVSRDMVGYEDLDANGTWQTDPTYGPMWTPRDVPAGWAPYRFGHWESIAPWGWTWIDNASWGFAPFHYGRWASVRGRWGWVPGSVDLRPVYAPALVAFVGGPGWGASVSFGGGGGVGWVPLAPGEPFVPAYRASTNYLQRANRPNVDMTRYHPDQVDVTRTRYANRDVAGAVTAVPRDVFVRSRPVAKAAVALRPADLVSVRPSPAPMIGGTRIAPAPRLISPARGRAVQGPPEVRAGRATPAPAPAPEWRARPQPVQPQQSTPAPRQPPQRMNPSRQPAAPPPTAAPTPSERPRPATPPAPAAQPALPPPAAQAPSPESVARTTRPSVRPVPPPTTDNTAQWQAQRSALIARQQQESAALAQRHQAQQKQVVRGTTPATLQQQQQAEKRALDDQHQRQRDQLDKQYRKPNER